MIQYNPDQTIWMVMESIAGKQEIYLLAKLSSDIFFSSSNSSPGL